ncbi:MAG: phosphatase PAP2 family protein [Phycisphaerales bacterium]|nr:phosphatase PAP2 family protein [Phycisphaerales bacterium]
MRSPVASNGMLNSTSLSWLRKRAARRVALTGIALCVVAGGFLGLDRWVYENISLRLNTPSPTDSDFYHLTIPIWDAIRFYPHIVGAAITFVAIVAVRRNGIRRANVALAAGLFSAFAAHFAQEAVGRYRPNHSQTGREFAAPLSGLRHKIAAGFPSGEVATACAMTWLLSREFRRLQGVFVALAIATAVARCAFGMHYLSDVVFGGLFGFWLCAAVQWATLKGLRAARRVMPRAAVAAR